LPDAQRFVGGMRARVTTDRENVSMPSLHLFCGTAACLAVALSAAPAMAEGDGAPSFDCGKAAGTIEHAICSDATLAGLDAELAVGYGQALAEAADPAALRLAQRDWAGQRGPACGLMPGADDDGADIDTDGIGCLLELYRARIVELAAVAAPVQQGADPAEILEGLWQVAEVIDGRNPTFAVSGQAISGQEGRLVRLNRHALAALGGGGCAGPTLEALGDARLRSLDPEEKALIGRIDAAAAQSAGGVAGLCLGRLFALYVPAGDGSLLVADATATYRLRRLDAGSRGTGAP
jgi:uncharacterized protein YecT (DUF1311 family)